MNLHFKMKLRPRGLLIEVGERVYLLRWSPAWSFEKYK